MDGNLSDTDALTISLNMGGGILRQKFDGVAKNIFAPVDINAETEVVLFTPDNGELARDEFFIPNVNNGLFRISAFLRSKGISSEIVNIGVDNFEISLAAIAKHETRILGVSPYYNCMQADIANISRMREVSPNSFIVIGGFEASLNEQWQNLEGLIDAIILGEGEQPLLALAQILKEWEVRSSKVGENRNKWVAKKLAETNEPGIMLYDGVDLCYHQPMERISTEFYQDVNLSAFVDQLTHSPFKKFLELSNIIFDGEKPSYFRFVSGDHCPLHCTFCQSSVLYSTLLDKKATPVKHLSPENTVRIIKRVNDYYPEVSHIYIDDENFLLYKRRAIEICDLLCEARKKREIRDNLRFLCRGTSRSVNPEICVALYNANFEISSIGSESYSDLELKVMNKTADSDCNISAIEMLFNHGLAIAENYILYSPVTTPDSFFESTSRICHNIFSYNVDGAAGGFMTPLAGTPLWGKGEFYVYDGPSKKANLFPDEVYFKSNSTPYAYLGTNISYKLGGSNGRVKTLHHPELVLLNDPVMHAVSVDAVHTMPEAAQKLAKAANLDMSRIPRPFITLSNIYAGALLAQKYTGEVRWMELQEKCVDTLKV